MRISLSSEAVAALEEVRKRLQCSRSEAVLWLASQASDIDSTGVISLWERIVVPYTPYDAPVATPSLLADIIRCGSFMPDLRSWEAAFRRLVMLRGATESGSFGLSRLVMSRPDGSLLSRLVSGAYDPWKRPRRSKIPLEQVLRGDDPGDWLNPPPPSDPNILSRWLERAQMKYAERIRAESPHSIAWANRYMGDQWWSARPILRLVKEQL